MIGTAWIPEHYNRNILLERGTCNLASDHVSRASSRLSSKKPFIFFNAASDKKVEQKAEPGDSGALAGPAECRGLDSQRTGMFTLPAVSQKQAACQTLESRKLGQQRLAFLQFFRMHVQNNSGLQDLQNCFSSFFCIKAELLKFSDAHQT